MAQRSCRLDNVKGLLMLLVVFAHLLELFSGPGRLWLYETIYLFHMPAFVYCSGYFARFSWKKVGKSLLPYALFQTLYVLFVLALGGRHAHPLTTPYWLMWYLFSMVLWTLCLPLAERCGPRLSLLLSAAAALAVGYVTGVGYPFSLSRTIVLLPFFLGGWIAGQRARREGPRPFPRWAAALGVLGAAAGMLTLARFGSAVSPQWLYHSYSYAAGGYGPGVRGLILLAGAAWTVVLLRWAPDRPLPFFTRLGRYTLPVFLLHGFCVKLLGRTSLFSHGEGACLLLSLGAAVGLCLLLGQPWAARMCQPWTWFSTGKKTPVSP